MKPIIISLSPNTTNADARRALSLLTKPAQWQVGASVAAIERAVADYLNAAEVCSFDSGRSGLYALLKVMSIGAGDEVLLQAYTCVVVPNPVLWCGARPVYVDIDENTLNMDVDDLARKITPRSRAIIVQHTFGNPAPLDEIMELARRHNLAVIEDCAHALGAEYHGRKLGTFGDAAFFSFGRDKIISAVYGGVAIANNAALGAKLRDFQRQLPYPSRKWIAQQLWHPIAFEWFILPTYFLNVGKVLLVAMQKSGMLSLAVSHKERRGGKPAVMPSRLPNALATLTMSQWARLEEYNAHRIELAEYYAARLANVPDIQLPRSLPDTKPIYLRYTIQTSRVAEMLGWRKTQRILLGNWYDRAIVPRGVDYAAILYDSRTCPVAERAATRSVNLPTHHKVTLDDAARIVELIRTNRINSQ